MSDKLVELLRRLAAGHEGTTASGGIDKIIIGLIGRGIQSSRTPGMHEREAQRLGIGYSYLLLDFDLLELADEAIADVIGAAQTAGFHGLNITHPFKQSVIVTLDGLSSEASAIGAVNTVVFDDETKHGHNTDCWGFAESFHEAMAGVRTDRVAMFGAGGAGAAIAYALMEMGTDRLSIVDSDASRAAALAERMRAIFGNRIESGSSPRAIDGVSGIVNATPVGMEKYPGTPFDAALIAPHQWVADIIYFPAETELLRRARAIGCRTLPGTGMAIHQAVRAFELFSGRKADRRAMAGHFEAAA